jgi:ribonuclease R
MPEVYKRKIMRLLKHADYRPMKMTQFARELDVSSEEYPRFKDAFDQMRQAGQVVIGDRNLVSLPPIAGRVIGKFRANPRGFGFVMPLDPTSHGDLYISAEHTGGAMTGDTVAARVLKQGKRGGVTRVHGKIVEILERGQDRFVGTLSKRPEGWMVQPDGKGFTEPVVVDDVTAKGAREKDKVVVEILSYPTAEYLARGVILEVLGRAGRYDSEIEAIMHQYHLPRQFDERCFEQAKEAAAGFEQRDTSAREDITSKVVITIDPPDAKDFDDAISLEKDAQGRWVLGVHIADVSEFVTDDSPLDVEAKERGNSVYLPGRVIPMLPEILSNGICSLQPEQKRFCKSAYITYDAESRPAVRRYVNSVMCSRQRLTYQQADKALKGHTKGIKPEVMELLRNMETLSRLIEKRRNKDGMLHLDLPEIELVSDKAGQIVDAHPADDSYPHTIIEMFMVEANEAVASLIDRENVPFMRRIHPEPDSLSLKNLAKVLRSFGISIPKNPERKALQAVLEGVKGSDVSLAVNMLILRSLQKAVYSPLSIGHYALASTHYCHFTSPIRRYADLLVHRLLERYFEGGLKAGADGVLNEQQLTETGKHITFTEERADDAEEELKDVLILEMLSGRIGSELDCVVTGVASFGVFAKCKKFGIEGLIQPADLGPDKWDFNANAQCIVGRNSGCTVHLGQPIRVRIISVNVPARQLNIAPLEPLVKPSRKPEAIREKRKGKGFRTRKRRSGRRR